MQSKQNYPCPLCGYTFDATALSCHTTCPMGKACNLICCPNCGYQVPDEDRMGIAGALKQAWEARRAKRKESQSDAAA